MSCMMLPCKANRPFTPASGPWRRWKCVSPFSNRRAPTRKCALRTKWRFRADRARYRSLRRCLQPVPTDDLSDTSTMIEDPPLLQIRRNFARPGIAMLKRFAAVPTEHLVDAMDGRGALDFMVKPIDPSRASFVGSAVTCLCAPGDNLAIVGALA